MQTPNLDSVNLSVIILYFTLCCKSHSHSTSLLLFSSCHVFQLFGAGGAPALAANCCCYSTAAATVLLLLLLLLLTPRPHSGTSSHVSFPTNCPLSTALSSTSTPLPAHAHTTRYEGTLARLRASSIPRKYICIRCPPRFTRFSPLLLVNFNFFFSDLCSLLEHFAKAFDCYYLL